MWFRAINQAGSVYGYSNRPPEMEQFIHENRTLSHLQTAIEDPAIPVEEAYEACSEVLARGQRHPPDECIKESINSWKPQCWANGRMRR